MMGKVVVHPERCDEESFKNICREIDCLDGSHGEFRVSHAWDMLVSVLHKNACAVQENGDREKRREPECKVIPP
jgi:hypothetical protein